MVAAVRETTRIRVGIVVDVVDVVVSCLLLLLLQLLLLLSLLLCGNGGGDGGGGGDCGYGGVCIVSCGGACFIATGVI